MTGLGTGRCGFSGCENPCPRDEDFCCTGCEEAQGAEDAENAIVAFGARVDEARPSLRARIEALPRVMAWANSAELYGAVDRVQAVKLSDVLALLDPECSLCEAGHVPAEPCAIIEEREIATRAHPATAAFEQMDRERPRTTEYPRTEFNEDAGVWVEWSNPWHGKIVAPPTEDEPFGDVSF